MSAPGPSEGVGIVLDMAGASTLTRAPTLGDARRAAAALVGAGAGRVMLFGSLAEGRADSGSDIDMAVICDDIDYARRWDTEKALAGAASEACGFAVDVVLRDRPEWRMRTEQVATSLERHIDVHGLVLADSPAGVIDWDKEMTMPRSDAREALSRLEETARSLSQIQSGLWPWPDEQAALDAGHRDRHLRERTARFEAGLCAPSQMVIETVLKSLLQSVGVSSSDLRTHNISVLFQALPSARWRQDVEELLRGLDYDDITYWRAGSAYFATAVPGPEATLAYVTELVSAACRVADFASRQFTEVGSLEEDPRPLVRDKAAAILDALRSGGPTP